MSISMARVLGAFMALAICFPPLALLGYIAGPTIEGMFFPVTKVGFVAGTVIRAGPRLCWDYTFEKRRDAMPAYFAMVLVDRGLRIPVTGYKPGVDFPSTYGFTQHPVGAKWTATYCIDIPTLIDRSLAYSIEGEAIYNVWHKLWQPRQPLPSLSIPAL